MASPVETPQEFKYETKFVVLNYLGILPKFEEIGDESDTESDEKLLDDDGEDRMSFDLGSQASSSSNSRDTSSSIDSNSCSRDSDDFRQIRRIAAAAIAPRSDSPPIRSFVTHGGSPPTRSFHTPRQMSQDQNLQVDAIDEDTLEGFKLATDDLVKDYNAQSGSSSASSSKFSASPPSFASRMPSLKVSLAESPRTRRSQLKKKRSKDVSMDEETKAKMSNVLSELESQFKNEMLQDGLDTAGVLCAISREALVAERIAQIGDCIMMHHHDELDQAYQQVMARGDGAVNYNIFKAGMKSIVKNTVPGWYHLAVMMKYTRALAVNVLDQGSRGIAAVTDMAAQYIEENLAQSIIEQGGWDAMTNVDLDKIDSETWSDLSSGNPSPRGTQSPSTSTPPLFMDREGYLSPRQSQSGASSSQGGQSQQSMSGLNDASQIKAETELTSGQPARDESDSVATGPTRPHGLAILDRAVAQDMRDISPGSRRRYLSERTPDSSSGLDDSEDSPRRRSASFGAGPMIATAAAATATVAAVAAVGAYAILKK